MKKTFHPYADLTLWTGSRMISEKAKHPWGQFQISATNGFNVTETNSIADTYDSAGNVTNRVFTIHMQVFRWDGAGPSSATTAAQNFFSFNWFQPAVKFQWNGFMQLPTFQLQSPIVPFSSILGSNPFGPNGPMTTVTEHYSFQISIPNPTPTPTPSK